MSALKNESQGPSDRLRLRNAFVVAQVAFSILLVVGAGLLGARAARGRGRSIGASIRAASRSRRWTCRWPATRARPGRSFARELVDRVRELPGVQDATTGDEACRSAADRTEVLVRRGARRWRPPPDRQPLRRCRLELGRARLFRDAADSARRRPRLQRRRPRGQPPVAIVNEDRRAAVCGRARTPSASTCCSGQPVRDADADLLRGRRRERSEVPGRAGDPRRPFVYAPLQQRYTPRLTILARTTHGAAHRRADPRAGRRRWTRTCRS